MYSVPQDRMGPKNEIVELLKAWAGTTLAFAILLRSPQRDLPEALLLAGVTVALGIIGHELAHRAVARYFGCWARFIANDAMLVLAILMAFTGFLFAAPGAVWHSGYISKRQSGLIAAAGPATNMALAIVCLALVQILPLGTRLWTFVWAGYTLNAWLGLFNMIPFGPLDGAKVLNWSGAAFAVMAGLGLFLVFGMPRLL